jgi:hypothetical protein
MKRKDLASLSDVVIKKTSGKWLIGNRQYSDIPNILQIGSLKLFLDVAIIGDKEARVSYVP